MTLLAVEELSIHFATRRGIVQALDSVTLSIGTGEIVGLVGESGSGKSVLSYALAGLLDPAARKVSGGLRWHDAPLPLARRDRRGVRIAQIFQNPRGSLNPIRTVGHQLADGGGRARVGELLENVRMPPDLARRYPFELSGGQCQRVGIALALARDPQLLIADEPTSGLDSITAAAAMTLIRELALNRGMATLFVTHDLALAAANCDRIAVMHAGQIVEVAPTETLIRRGRHPYSRLLVAATPQHCALAADLQTIPGQLPSLLDALPPCRFAARCDRRTARCDALPLPSGGSDPNNFAACHHPLS